ncbi:MAG: hypothetical protein ACYC2U_07965 [Candidatus Amoebophilus sp.]
MAKTIYTCYRGLCVYTHIGQIGLLGGGNNNNSIGKSELNKAAEQGYVKAQFNLGWIYNNGRGVGV